jgi:threonine aldolase
MGNEIPETGADKYLSLSFLRIFCRRPLKDDIDLRSDTVAKPTPAMRKAVTEVDVGDDVFGEDPTANALQEKVAILLEKKRHFSSLQGRWSNQLFIEGIIRAS